MKPRTWMLLCAVLLIGTIALSRSESIRSALLTTRPETIDADAVILLHGHDRSASSEAVTITDPESVSELVSLHNSLKLQSMSRPAAGERMWVVFYRKGELVTEWCISHYADDGMLITSSQTFGGGNHVIQSEFDYDAIIETFNTATARQENSG